MPPDSSICKTDFFSNFLSAPFVAESPSRFYCIFRITAIVKNKAKRMRQRVYFDRDIVTS